MRKYITKASERIGVESTSRDGKRAQVVSYSSCENFIIRFCDGKEMKLKNWRYFIEGNFNYEKHFKAPRNREERIGEKKVMNNGLTAEVIEYRGSHDMDILFEDGGKRTGVSWRDFCIGSIAHPTIPGGNVSQNELVLRFYLESLGFVRIPQRSKRSDRVGLEGKELDLYNDTGSVAVPSCYARNHIGDKKIQNRGNEEAEIIEVKDANHITVKFKDGTIVKDRKYEDFIHGAIGKPGIPQLRRTLKNERLWTEKIMRNGMKAKIVRYGSANDIDIKFSNGTIVMHKTYANFCSGSVACK